MMARVQVSLSPEDRRRAQLRATDLGISFAEYVRRLVVRDLGDARRTSDPQTLFDLGDSAGADIAHEKDRYVGEAFEAMR